MTNRTMITLIGGVAAVLWATAGHAGPLMPVATYIREHVQLVHEAEHSVDHAWEVSPCGARRDRGVARSAEHKSNNICMKHEPS